MERGEKKNLKKKKRQIQIILKNEREVKELNGGE